MSVSPFIMAPITGILTDGVCSYSFGRAGGSLLTALTVSVPRHSRRRNLTSRAGRGPLTACARHSRTPFTPKLIKEYAPTNAAFRCYNPKIRHAQRAQNLRAGDMQRTIRSTFLSFYHRIFASPLSLHPNNPFYQSKWVRTRFVHSPASAPSHLQSLTSL